LDYRILGSLEVCRDGMDVALAGERQRVLLAILLLHANEVVSADAIIDALWGERPPPSALNAVHVSVSRLRRAVWVDGEARSDGVLATRGRGYVLRVEHGELDVDRFRGLLEQGREELAAGDPTRAAGTLRSALAIWRGRPLADFVYEPFAQPAIAELEELRLAALEERFEADLALGAPRELVGELSAAVGHNPLRERLRAQLMLALYRCGRQAEALDLYQEFRRTLSAELGLEPGPGLRQLELAILERDAALDLPADAAASQPPAPGSTTPHAKTAGRDRRRLILTIGGSLLLTLVLAVVGMVSKGGATRLIPSNSIAAIDPSSAGITDVEQLGTVPSAIAAGDRTVWVANYDAGTVSAFNTASCTCQTIATGGTPSAIALGAGAVWVTDASSAKVLRINPTTDGIVKTYQVGRAPTAVAVGDGSVWVANSGDGTLSRIQATTPTGTATIPLGGSPSGVAVGADAVWVSDRADRRVLRIDPQTDGVTSVNVGTGPTAVAVGFGSIWVTNSLDGTVSKINPTTSAVDATIPVGDGAAAIAIAPDSVWVASQYAGTISKIDPTSDTVLSTFKVAHRVAGLAFSGGRLWAGSQPAPEPHRGGTLTVLSRIWIDTFDPAVTHSAHEALDLTNDGLIAYERVGGSGSMQLVPDLAVSLPTPTDGGTTYTFQLRPGIHYSNGEPVRPEDFRRALERELILGATGADSRPFANVLGGRACAANPSHCDLSRGVVTDDIVDLVTFHLVAPDPGFLARLTLTDASAVPAGTPNRDIGLHPLPATGPYMWASVTNNQATLVRNPYFHEWSRAARPDGYPDRIVFRRNATQTGELGNYQYSFQQDMLWDQRWVR
jgi:YVTN family beta-propeller protein